jgi:hypothetical protein
VEVILPHQRAGFADAGAFGSARLAGTGQALAVSRAGDYAEFTLPALEQYELVELR